MDGSLLGQDWLYVINRNYLIHGQDPVYELLRLVWAHHRIGIAQPLLEVCAVTSAILVFNVQVSIYTDSFCII